MHPSVSRQGPWGKLPRDPFTMGETRAILKRARRNIFLRKCLRLLVVSSVGGVWLGLWLGVVVALLVWVL